MNKKLYFNELILIIFTMSLIQCTGTKKVKRLFSESGKIKNKAFNYEQLEGLPQPVQKYFRYSLKDNQPYISYLRLKHGGEFKTAPNNDWMDISGEQYFTTQKPGFVWIGKTMMFNAHDSFIDGNGNLSVYLLGFIRIAKSSGEKTNQAELLRWLGESVWLPTNLLPNDNKKWTAIDKNTAKLSFTYKGIETYYIVSFNDKGQITQLKTQRYYGDKQLTPWLGEVSQYKKVNGMMIPAKIEGSWLLDNGKYTYARFNVTKFEFDVPEKF